MNNAADDLSAFFLGQGEQQADAVMARLVSFIAQAQTSLDMAFYDMRLSDGLKQQLLELSAVPRRGCRSAFATTPTNPRCRLSARDRTRLPSGTGAFVQSLGFPFRRIGVA